MSSKTDEQSDKEEDINTHEEQLENIRKKLKTNHPNKQNVSKLRPQIDRDGDDEFEEYYLHKDRDLEKKKKM